MHRYSRLGVFLLLLAALLSELHETQRRKDWVTEKCIRKNLCEGHDFLASPLPPYVFFFANATNRNKGWNSCHWTHKLVMSRAFSNTSQATFNCWNISFSLITFKNILDFPVNNKIFLLKSFSDSLNYITICFKICPATWIFRCFAEIVERQDVSPYITFERTRHIKFDKSFWFYE